MQDFIFFQEKNLSNINFFYSVYTKDNKYLQKVKEKNDDVVDPDLLKRLNEIMINKSNWVYVSYVTILRGVFHTTKWKYKDFEITNCQHTASFCDFTIKLN